MTNMVEGADPKFFMFLLFLWDKATFGQTCD